MDAWTVYLICMLDSAKAFFGSIGVVLILASISFGIALVVTIFEESDSSVRIEDREAAKNRRPFLAKATPISIFLCTLMFTLSSFLPSTKQAIAIYTIPKITQNKQIENISEKSLDLVEEKLNSYLEDLKSKEEE